MNFDFLNLADEVGDDFFLLLLEKLSFLLDIFLVEDNDFVFDFGVEEKNDFGLGDNDFGLGDNDFGLEEENDFGLGDFFFDVDFLKLTVFLGTTRIVSVRAPIGSPRTFTLASHDLVSLCHLVPLGHFFLCCNPAYSMGT
jgi:hypothetical protein